MGRARGVEKVRGSTVSAVEGTGFEQRVGTTRTSNRHPKTPDTCPGTVHLPL